MRVERDGPIEWPEQDPSASVGRPREVELDTVGMTGSRVEPPAAAAQQHRGSGAHGWWQRLHCRRERVFAGCAIVDRICWHFRVAAMCATRRMAIDVPVSRRYAEA
jgi:hypothetical protein